MVFPTLEAIEWLGITNVACFISTKENLKEYLFVYLDGISRPKSESVALS